MYVLHLSLDNRYYHVKRSKVKFTNDRSFLLPLLLD